MSDVARALWLAVPVVCGGLVHVVVIKLDMFARLHKVPLDLGLSVRGRRVFGDNKTARGALVMIAATALCAGVCAGIAVRFGLAVPWQTAPVVVGALLGAGYIVGELPNSFVKRQLGIAPGQSASGVGRFVVGVVDQVDSLGGALVFVSLAEPVTWTMVAVLVVITLTVHPAVGALMVALGLKRRVG